MRNNVVSIKDVAAECGVSISTVSKALNDHADVSKAKKELIRETAKRMGYQPNSSARALKTNRSRNIGVLFVEESQSGLTHDFFARILDSFKVTIENKGYDLTFIVSKKNHFDNMTYLEHARFRKFDGVMICCVDFDKPEVRKLMESEIPTVIIDYIFNNTCSILSDNIQGMSRLTQYAIDKGHEKIAYLYGENSLVTSQRLSGFYITLEKNKIKIPDEYVVEARYRNVSDAEKITRRLLESDNPPTCIFYPDDYACLGGVNAIRDMGLAVGDDVSIAGYDGMPIVKHIEPKITTVVQNTALIGSSAAEKLVNLIEKPKTTIIEQITINSELYEGKTIKDINK